MVTAIMADAVWVTGPVWSLQGTAGMVRKGFVREKASELSLKGVGF